MRERLSLPQKIVNYLEEAKRKTKKEFSDKDFYSSLETTEYFARKCRHIFRDFHIPECAFEMVYEEASPLTACTDDHRILVNAGNPLYSGSEKERFSKVLGTILHEVGHRLFTNFNEQKKFIKALENGTLYPGFPETLLNGLNSDRLDQLLDLLQDPERRKPVVPIMQDLWNCLEDGREECMIQKYVQDANIMMAGLHLIREEFYQHQTATLSEYIEKIDKGELKKFEALLQLILNYGRFRDIKGYDDSFDMHPVIIRMNEIIPYLDDYLDADRSVKAYQALNVIMVLCIGEIKEYVEEIKKEQQESQKEGNGNTSESGSSGSFNSKVSGDELSNAVSNALKEKIQGMTTDNTNNMTTSGSDRPSVMNAIQGIQGKSIPDPERMKREYTSSFKTDGTGKREYIKDSGCVSSELTLDFNALKGKSVLEMADETAEKLLLAEYKRISKDVNFVAAHKQCDFVFHRSELHQSMIDAYSKVQPEIKRLAQKMAKKSDFFEADREPYYEKNQYFGQKFKVQSIYKKDLKYFDRKVQNEEPPKLAVSVVIDQSGSMGGTRVAAAKLMALLSYEYCSILSKKGIYVPINIIGHSSTNGNCRIDVYSDSEKPDPKDRYRMMCISAGGNNRDGAAIRLALTRLESYQECQKLLFIVTDGQPNSGSYRGTIAEADLRDVTNHCEKTGISLIVAAIGDDKKRISEIYGEKHFLDITDLNTLPIRMIKIIREMLK